MSYRNDHEAALHRVESLEQEVARLRSAAAPSATPATKPPVRSSTWRYVGQLARAGLATTLIAASVVAIASRDRATVDAAPSTPVPARVAELPASFTLLRDCIAEIAPVTKTIDAATTDPHGVHERIDWLANTGAPCRRELATYDDVALDPAVRDQLRRWSAAEDRLANSISLIAVYYDDDPYLLDNYASAPQLWREYHRSRLDRNETLGQLARALDHSTVTR